MSPELVGPYTYRQTYIETDRRTDGETDGQTDKQANHGSDTQLVHHVVCMVSSQLSLLPTEGWPG